MAAIAKACATCVALRNGIAGFGHTAYYFRDLTRQNRFASKSDAGFFADRSSFTSVSSGERRNGAKTGSEDSAARKVARYHIVLIMQEDQPHLRGTIKNGEAPVNYFRLFKDWDRNC